MYWKHGHINMCICKEIKGDDSFTSSNIWDISSFSSEKRTYIITWNQTSMAIKAQNLWIHTCNVAMSKPWVCTQHTFHFSPNLGPYFNHNSCSKPLINSLPRKHQSFKLNWLFDGQMLEQHKDVHAPLLLALKMTINIHNCNVGQIGKR